MDYSYEYVNTSQNETYSNISKRQTYEEDYYYDNSGCSQVIEGQYEFNTSLGIMCDSGMATGTLFFFFALHEKIRVLYL